MDTLIMETLLVYTLLLAAANFPLADMVNHATVQDFGFSLCEQGQ